MRENIFKIFENLPSFSKQNLRICFKGSRYALDERIKRAIKNEYILELKKGLYVTNLYFLKEPQKSEYKEYLASKLRFPSYLSLEYVLSTHDLLTEAIYTITSITLKTTRKYTNFLGIYRYLSIKKDLFFGFEKKSFYKNEYYVATKAKAMFDFLYLKRNLGNLEKEILEGLRINWDSFLKEDYYLFGKYVKISQSLKMQKIFKILGKIYA